MNLWGDRGDREGDRPPRMAPRLSRIVMGPARLGTHRVILRPPRLDDAEQWRRVRVRNRRFIEPFWAHSSLSWEERHSDRVWLREVLDNRRRARAGSAVGFVIELDGALAGQVALTDIDHRTRSAELGIWIDLTAAADGLAVLCVSMVVDFAFDDLRIHRLTAPASVDNCPAIAAAKRFGFQHEALLRDYVQLTDSTLRDHLLFSIVRSDLPPDGCPSRTRVVVDPRDHAALSAPVRFPRQVTRDALTDIGRYQVGRARDRLRPWHRNLPVSMRSDDGIWFTRIVRDRTKRFASGDDRSAVRFAVTVDGRPAGECGLDRPEPTSPNVTAWFVPAAELDARVVGTLLDHAFAVGGVRRVALAAIQGDAVSSGVSCAGLECEGVMRMHTDILGRTGDHELWAITERAWRARERVAR